MDLRAAEGAQSRQDFAVEDALGIVRRQRGATASPSSRATPARRSGRRRPRMSAARLIRRCTTVSKSSATRFRSGASAFANQRRQPAEVAVKAAAQGDRHRERLVPAHRVARRHRKVAVVADRHRASRARARAPGKRWIRPSSCATSRTKVGPICICEGRKLAQHHQARRRRMHMAMGPFRASARTGVRCRRRSGTASR